MVRVYMAPSPGAKGAHSVKRRFSYFGGSVMGRFPAEVLVAAKDT
jgi:hypothetical protein